MKALVTRGSFIGGMVLSASLTVLAAPLDHSVTWVGNSFSGDNGETTVLAAAPESKVPAKNPLGG